MRMLTSVAGWVLGAWCGAAQAGAVTYWNLFNVEGESQAPSVYVTYASLLDVLTDSNRTGAFIPDAAGNSARNVVGSGAFLMDLALPVPEPDVAVLLAGGLFACVLLRRRRIAPAQPSAGVN